LLFPSGYQANLGLIGALVGRGDAIISDELAHASLIDAARLSRARILIQRHGDVSDLERCLIAARGARRTLVLTEGVFSMDGDVAPLDAYSELCARHGALLVVDEAHSAGLIGPAGAGAWLAARARFPQVLAARLVTGGKALGVCGALVVGSRALCESLVHRARSFVFTTAPTPAVSGALVAAIEIARSAEVARERVLGAARDLARRLDLPEPAAAIVPLLAGSETAAVALERELGARGLDARCVRPPTVPAGTSRLRIVMHAFNSTTEVDQLAHALQAHKRPLRVVAPAVRRASTLFVAGTDTGVGKTVLSALLVRAGNAGYWKPVQTGADSDTATVAQLSAERGRSRIEPLYEFSLPAAPDWAAAVEQRSIDFQRLRERLQELKAQHERLVVELAGGLLVPLDERRTQLDWLSLELAPTVLVARAGLGTLNHTLLSLEALRSRGIEPAAIVLVGEAFGNNAQTLARLGGCATIIAIPRLVEVSAPHLDELAISAELAGLWDAVDNSCRTKP
jgi:8-amino-7-oxononanoate synthase